MSSQTFLRFPNSASRDRAVTVLAQSKDDRSACECILRLKFPNYIGKPDSGYGVPLEDVLDLIETERAASPTRKERTPESYRYANRKHGRTIR